MLQVLDQGRIYELGHIGPADPGGLLDFAINWFRFSVLSSSAWGLSWH